jgi:CheY-like chemotaxis protein
MRILIVDDEFAALKKMEILLADYGETDCATNGRQALEMYANAIMEHRPYGLATIDIHIPELDGLELLQRLNACEKNAGAACARKLMVTASQYRQCVMDAVLHHCDAYIIKPIQRDFLHQKLSELGIEPARVEPVGSR